MDERKVISPIYFDESLIRHKVEFEVPGKPFGKQRPRVVHRGGFSRAYTPKETVEYEKKVKSSYKKSTDIVLENHPIEAKILGIFPIPESTSKKKRNFMTQNKVHHTKKPDCDNIGKAVLDALNGIAYQDDSQICKLSVEKIYGEDPRVIVCLKEID